MYINQLINLCTITVDPHLSGPEVSSHLDFADRVLTIQSECFVRSVHFIKVFELSAVYKCMGFNYPYLNTP